MTRRVAAMIIAAVLAGLGWLVHDHFGRPVAHLAYWWAQSRQPAVAGSFRVIILGDSSALGVGAGWPTESLAGRTVEELSKITGRPVQAINLATGGARTAEATRQASAIELAAADLVLVSVGSADVLARLPLDDYARDVGALLAVLPADRTLCSDLAAVPGHEPYQARFAELADAAVITRGPFEASFQAAGRTDVFAPDGVHLNSRGYGIWFAGLRDRLEVIVRRG